MQQSEDDLQEIHDKQRLEYLDIEIDRIRREISILKEDLKFANHEKSDIEYRLKTKSACNATI